ncbi:MAG: hypothetical protein ABI705_09945 [Aestuariivirga sp.]
MNNQAGDMSARLKELGRQIDHAEAKLKLKRPLTLDHKITNAEMRARYRVLIKEVSESEQDVEEHGRHVGTLEHSVRLWLANIDRGGT